MINKEAKLLNYFFEYSFWSYQKFLYHIFNTRIVIFFINMLMNTKRQIKVIAEIGQGLNMLTYIYPKICQSYKGT